MQKRECLRLIEPTIVQDVWVDGIGRVEMLSADACRVYWYRIRRPTDGDRTPYGELVATFLTTLSHLRGFGAEAIEMLPPEATDLILSTIAH